MSKNIDLSSLLSEEKPSLTINGKTYVVNDEKTNVLKMNDEMKKMSKGNEEDRDDFAILSKIIEMLVGKKAAKEIDALPLSFSQYQEVFFALLALVNNEELEVVKARFHGQ
ncbi:MULTISPECIES: hypothetical protein [unclassified Breznakia]|uniref:hypothetical protein n=1 Tax=unclassified Breznakia TaxID=2623764 RepID=UPI002475312F|nr:MULTISPECIES: hypothetical protein [unclassified Breznakia]MDH6367558.1 hypothetical protein [Breznakia sp. PH1-1]MDH6404648.1 hypothetical protein [Breznakia sp. PF1-11]MDH6412388.1 hypothetical protein [Breznakia sp. PFB1-11]MDH6414726.1 hypothetical protein [Breznakia sp. PFB1-14]MDH6417029.1 hypothetical protein [Breznakia sp. PFB1-4]